MLANNIAIIPKYYEIKSNLLPKNTVKTVDVEENEVSVVGYNTSFSNYIWELSLYDWQDSYLTKSGRWISYEQTSVENGTNTDPQSSYGYKSIELSNSTLGTLVYKLENTFGGDSNAENYSISNAVSHYGKYQSVSSGVDCVGISGSWLNTGDKQFDTNSVAPVITISGNWIYFTFNNVLIKTYVTYHYEDSTWDYSQQLYLYSWSFDISYGGFAVKTITSTFGDSDKKFPYEVSENGFYEIHSFFNEVNNDGITTQTKISQHNANTIINKWQNGKQYVECEIPMTTYYNENGDVLVAENTNKQLFEQYDLLTFKSKGVYNYIDENGNAKIFKVLQIDFVYDGGKIMKLKCIEV